MRLRLRGRDPEFVVAAPPAEETPATEADGPPIGEEWPAARINVRLPEDLKTAIEDAAAKEGRSVNAWLVRAAASALQRPERDPEPRGSQAHQRLAGWVR